MNDPAFLFYPNDYVGGTLGMTFEQKGAYIDLLMMQFNRGHMTSHMIGQVLGQKVDELWPVLKEKFKIDADGMYYNERLEIEKNKRKAFTDSRKNNILGKNQYSKNKGHTDGHMDGHMTSHMENRNENIFIYNLKEEKAEKLTPEKFYKKELEISQNDATYQTYIDTLFGKNEAGIKLTGILSMRDQLTYDQFKKLIEKSKSKNESLIKLSLSFENGKYYNGKKSLYLSLNDWLNKR